MIYENILMSMKAILANKMRSVLTILGIVIGIASVIAMLAVGEGAQKFISGSIEKMGTNLLIIRAGSAQQGMVRLETQDRLELDDYNALFQKLSDFAIIVPEVQTRGQVKYQNQNANVPVFGITPDYFKARNYQLSIGIEFMGDPNQNVEKICILGKTVVSELFGENQNPIGATIRINRIPFKVIGVYQEKGSSGFRDEDEQIFIPLLTAQKRMTGDKTVQTIYASIKNKDDTAFVQQQIETILRRTRQLSNNKESNFSIRSQLELLDTMNGITNAFKLLLGSIALISLIVGGIGIMNILLVSVTERTKEIGIRKAIGAYESDILIQFLIEAIMLCFIGGMIGIILGVGVSYLIGLFSQWKPVVTLFSILISLAVTLTVGIFFGYYPARKAARLDPIDALRYE